MIAIESIAWIRRERSTTVQHGRATGTGRALYAAGMARGCQQFRRVNAHAHLRVPRNAARIGMSRPPLSIRSATMTR